METTDQGTFDDFVCSRAPAIRLSAPVAHSLGAEPAGIRARGSLAIGPRSLGFVVSFLEKFRSPDAAITCDNISVILCALCTCDL